MVSEGDVLEALQAVEDPELEISIVELGLVYAVRIEAKDEGPHAEIDMTLTSPGCPAAPEIMAATHRAALNSGLTTVQRWDPSIHASEDARMDMGIWD